MAKPGLNLRAAVAATAAGVAVVASGVLVGGIHRAVWSSVLINMGTTVGLVAILLVLEQRITRRVTRETREVAREVAAHEVADLRERVIRLEDLDDAQSETRRQRLAEQDAVLERFKRDPIDVANVGRLLLASHDEQLFDYASGRVRFRTSSIPQCHLLYMLGHASAEQVWAIFLDFAPIQMGPPINGIPMPAGTSQMSMWTDDSPAEVACALEDSLTRENEPLHSFSLQFAIERLHRSVEAARSALRAPADDPKRLDGKIQLLINEEWAITSSGLESLLTPAIFRPGRAAGARSVFAQSYKGPREQVDESSPAWIEAAKWVAEREGMPIEFDEDPPRRREPPSLMGR